MGDESVMYVEEQHIVNTIPSESDPILNADEYSSEIITHLKSVEVRKIILFKWFLNSSYLKFCLCSSAQIHAKMELYDQTTGHNL